MDIFSKIKITFQNLHKTFYNKYNTSGKETERSCNIRYLWHTLLAIISTPIISALVVWTYSSLSVTRVVIFAMTLELAYFTKITVFAVVRLWKEIKPVERQVVTWPVALWYCYVTYGIVTWKTKSDFRSIDNLKISLINYRFDISLTLSMSK